MSTENEPKPRKPRAKKASTAELEAKIAELEAKLSSLSSQVSTGETRTAPPPRASPPPPPKPRPAETKPAETTTASEPIGEVAPAYAKIGGGNRYYATRARLAYHPPDKQFRGTQVATAAQAAPPPKQKKGTLPAGWKP